jgi:ABC-type tungstate transport system substrate-binding protein
MEARMTNRRERQMRATDLTFGVLALLSLIMLVVNGFLPDVGRRLDVDSMIFGGALLTLTVLVAFAMQRIADLDRRCSEDYRFQLMAQSALVAVFTTFVVYAAFDDFLLGYWLGVLSGRNVVGIMLGAWAFAYFVYRVKGARA